LSSRCDFSYWQSEHESGVPRACLLQISDKIASEALKRIDNDWTAGVQEQGVTITFISIENMTDAQ